MPLVEAKRDALTTYKASPSEINLLVLKTARSKVQQAARQCANEYWLHLCSKIQLAADTGNIKAMYDGIKQALGPTRKKTAPLKSSSGSIIQERDKQMERWVEHYSDLYAQETKVTEEALTAVESLPVLHSLDAEPTTEELTKALDALKPGKAPGQDGIPAEVLKCCKGPMLIELHKILILCWKEGAVPQDMRDANIITLYKNKGDRSDCNNYRGISLLSIVGKLFARVVLNASRYLQKESTQSHSVGSEQTGPLLTWCFPFGSCKKSAGSNVSRSTWLSLTLPKPLIW